MAVLVKLKFLLSILLVSCLFLPLSQCTSSAKTGSKPNQTEITTDQYVFKSPNEVSSWTAALALLSPLIILIFNRKNRHNIKASIALVICSGAAFYVAMGVTLFSQKILPAGYIAYTSSTSLMLLGVIDLLRLFKKQHDRSKHRNQPNE